MRVHFSTLSLGAMSLAAMLLSGNASATPITYIFSNASFVINGNTETITGQFGFDLSTGLESDVQITVTGADAVSGNYSAVTGGYAGNTSQISADGASNALTIYFAGPLSGADDALSLVAIPFRTFGESFENSTSAAGIATAVPEPASMAILGLGAITMLATRKRRTSGPA